MDFILLIVRLVVPLTIFKFPLLGGLASFLLDGGDWFSDLLGLTGNHDTYQTTDKLLDLYYLTIEFLVLRSWKNKFAKKIAGFLFGIRGFGILAFWISGYEPFLFYFPNVFESFFLFYLTVWFFLRREPKIKTGLILATIIISIPKLVQEYLMHVKMMTDWRFTHVPLLKLTYDNIFHHIVIVLAVVLIVIFYESRNRK
jgi:hypothetical protein